MIKSHTYLKASFKNTLFQGLSLMPLLSLVTLLFFSHFFLQEIPQKLVAQNLQKELNEFRSALEAPAELLADDKNCLSFLSQNTSSKYNSQLSLFSARGDLVCSVFREGPLWKEFKPEKNQIALSPEILEALQRASIYKEITDLGQNTVALISITKTKDSSGEFFYLEKTTALGPSKENLPSLVLTHENGKIVAASNSDFLLYTEEQLKTIFQPLKGNLAELSIRNKSFYFFTSLLTWGDKNLFLSVGLSGQEEQSILGQLSQRLFLISIGVGLIFLILAHLLTRLLSKPLERVVFFLKDLSNSDEINFLSIGNFKEFQIISDEFNRYNGLMHEQKKGFKKRILDLEQAKKSLNKLQEEIFSLSNLIKSGERLYLVLDQLQKTQKETPEKLFELIDATSSTLKSREEEKTEVNFIKTLELELADLILKGRLNNQIERKYQILPTLHANHNEIRLALRKTFSQILELVSPRQVIIIETISEENLLFKLNVIIPVDLDPVRAEVFNFSKSLFLKNNLYFNITSEKSKEHEQARVSLWMN